MRKLAQELGVEAMSLYHHVANMGDIRDGIVDVVFSEIELPAGEADWKAPPVRRRGDLGPRGSPSPLVDHVFSALDSYIYGFAPREASLPLRLRPRSGP
jgi:AcrR family transcriptional regulator